MSNVKTVMGQAAGDGVLRDNAWDLSFAYYNGDSAWDISEFHMGQNYDVNTREAAANGVFFKPDGTKMYVVGSTGDEVNEFELSTPWFLNTSTVVWSHLFSLSAQETAPQDIFFKPDGTKMYIIGSTGDEVNEYDLSAAWDTSTASFLQNFSVSTEETLPTGIFFKPDGAKMYIVGSTTDFVHEYDLSTAWDISTAVYLQEFDVDDQETAPQGISFKPDGTKMYVVGSSSDSINEYDLSTAWDISSASFTRAADTLLNTPTGLYFSPDGQKMFVCDPNVDRVYGYYFGGFDVEDDESNPFGLHFKPDGTKMFVIGNGDDRVVDYDLSTPWKVSTAVLNQYKDVSSQETAPQDLFFKPDGTKFYTVGSQADVIDEWHLSTAWDVSTAVFSDNFSFGSQEADGNGIFFKTDGTKMYIVGNTNDTVYEYDLSTAWDVTTATYNSNFFSVASEEPNPNALSFKPDGTKMYIVGQTGGTSSLINEYDLSIAWDVTTSVYSQNFYLSFEDEQAVEGLFFKPDGTKFYTVGTQRHRVYTYSVGIQPEY